MKKTPPKKQATRKALRKRTQPVDQAEKKRTAQKVILKSYEPPDKPLTKLNTRRELLLLIAEGASDIVRDLFDRCFESFLRLTRYKATYTGEYTAAELFTLDSVNEEKERMESEIKIHGIVGATLSEEALRNLQRRCQDASDLHEDLLAWGENWNLKKDWVYQFCHRVLVDYWQKNYKRDRAKVPPLSTLRDVALQSGHLQPSPMSAAAPLVRATTTSYIKPDTNPKPIIPGFSGERALESWRSVVWEFAREIERQMTAPEEKSENKYTPWRGGFLGFTVGGKYIPPERRRIQAPKMSKHFPPIAEGVRSRNHVVTVEVYEAKVKSKIRVDLESSLAEYTPKEVRERWADRIFENCKPTLETDWQRYCDHLKKHGWVEVIEKRDLRRQCKWFLLYAVAGKTQGEIEIKEQRKVRKTNISQRIAEIAKWLDMAPVKRGDSGKVKFTWKN